MTPTLIGRGCTFDGARLQNHRQFQALSFGEKLTVIEGMNEVAVRLLEHRKRRGLPYLDPYTGELIYPAKSGI